MEAIEIEELVTGWISQIRRDKAVSVLSTESPVIETHQREVISRLRRAGVRFDLGPDNGGGLRLTVSMGNWRERR